MPDETFQKALFQDGYDLVAYVQSLRGPGALHREAALDEAWRQLSGGRSVLLVGPSGVGKTAVLHALARRLGASGRGVRALSTTDLLAGTRYLGEWQTKVTQILKAAEQAKVVLSLSDVWNLPQTGRTAQSNNNVFDVLRPALQEGRVQLLAEATPEQLRQMERVSGFVALFAVVEVTALSEPEVLDILRRATGLTEPTTLAAALQLTRRFLPARPQPGPALDLLERAQRYAAEKAPGRPLDAALLEVAFCEQTGLPPFVVSPRSTLSSRELRAWFEARLVGQRQAIEAVIEAIALFKAGLHDPTRPLATFLFVGPTGVGKTELARALATFLFGSPSRLLRFDLSEFKDFHSFETLIGSSREPDRPAALLDPVRAQPFQVVLLDELEKAHPNVYDLLLPLLDEGRLTPPGAAPVDFRSTLLIATSNVGAQESARHLGFGAAPGEAAREAEVFRQLEKTFRPEFLQRFQHVVAFHPLNREQVRAVARQELKRILHREGLLARNLLVEVDEEALDLVIARGVDPARGARALKRELQRQIVLPLAMLLMEQDLAPGTLLRVTRRGEAVRVRPVLTPEAREAKEAAAPVQAPNGQRLTRADLLARLPTIEARLTDLADQANEPWWHTERARLEEKRREPAFWHDAAAAARDLRDLDQATRVLERLERLRERLSALREVAAGADTRPALAGASAALVQLEADLTRAHRELVLLATDGHWEALVEVRPVGEGGVTLRDRLTRAYLAWTEAQGGEVRWLHDPLGPQEPVFFVSSAAYAAGLLAGEAGLHRLRVGETWSVARVRVAPWTDRRAEVRLGAHRALRAEGWSGQRVRSRLEVEGTLVLQNALTLTENRELAQEVAPSWAVAGAPSDEVVRRYEVEPPLLRDAATGFSSGRRDALEPGPFHELLVRRVEARAAQTQEGQAP